MRIGTSFLAAQQRILHSLAEAHAAAALSTLRRSSGRRPTRPADDPSAFLLIAALERDQSAVQVAIARVNAAANVGGQGSGVRCSHIDS